VLKANRELLLPLPPNAGRDRPSSAAGNDTVLALELNMLKLDEPDAPKTPLDAPNKPDPNGAPWDDESRPNDGVENVNGAATVAVAGTTAGSGAEAGALTSTLLGAAAATLAAAGGAGRAVADEGRGNAFSI